MKRLLKLTAIIMITGAMLLSACDDGGGDDKETPAPTDWVQDAYLKASNAASGDCFGYSVAISNETIVAGTFYEDSSQAGISNDDAVASDDNSAATSGAAYVFTLK